MRVANLHFGVEETTSCTKQRLSREKGSLPVTLFGGVHAHFPSLQHSPSRKGYLTYGTLGSERPDQATPKVKY